MDAESVELLQAIEKCNIENRIFIEKCEDRFFYETIAALQECIFI